MECIHINQIAIIGVGLIGGSFGMAVKKHRLATEVIGIGRNPERLQNAVRLGAIDHWTTNLEAGVESADIIYISTPVGMEVEFILRTKEAAKPKAIITDAGSTKAHICQEADKILPKDIRFVGGHPMAGSEATGVEAASADLFDGATYVLTPSERTDAEAETLISALVEGIGSRVIIMDPETHDRCVAVISHLPHIIAAALASLAREQSNKFSQIPHLIAGSFRDMTRVAGSSPELWRDICISNVEGILAAAAEFKRLLDEGLTILKSQDAAAFEEWFGQAKKFRDSIIDRKPNN